LLVDFKDTQDISVDAEYFRKFKILFITILNTFQHHVLG